MGLSAREFGFMVGLAFAVSALTSVPAGPAVDAIGGRILIVAIGALTAAGIAVLAASPTPATLLFAVLVAGLTQGMANPATNLVIAATAEESIRPRAMGIKQSGVPISALAAGGLPLLVDHLGIPTALGVVAVVAASVAIWSLVSDVGTALPPAWQRLSADVPLRAIAPLLTMSFCSGAAAHGTNTYLPLFAHSSLGCRQPSLGAPSPSSVGLV
jgi:MFS family permease